MRTLAIRLDDGRLIRDDTWHTVSDVIAGAHGQGERRVAGVLVDADTGEQVEP